MARAPGDANGARNLVMPYLAYAVVLALLAGAGIALWAKERETVRLPGLVKNDSASAPVAVVPLIEPSRLAPEVKPPPRPMAAAASAPIPAQAPASLPVPIPSVSSTTTPSSPPAPTPSAPAPADTSDAAAAPADKPASGKSKCTADVGSWPVDRTEQGKAIQGMLRDLGLYEGTVYGTVGPMTRAAIRRFQVAAGQPETGEPDEALFASLKKKCASPTP